MLALVLLAALDCVQLKEMKLPPEAIAAQKECGGEDDSWCPIDLAEQFANGDGVQRDFDVAAYFLCKAHDSMAEAEFEGMEEHLENMRDGVEDEPLRFCDHVTSGYGSTYCANVQWDELMPKLEARLDAVAKNKAFAALRERGNAFVQAETARIGEQSRGGTGYSAITLGAEMDAKQHFVESVEAWSKARAGTATAAQYKAADDALNAAYRSVVKELDEAAEISEETADWKPLLRDAQRAWIAYRDAFVAYYVERWRGSAPEAALRYEILTALTSDRAQKLR